MSDVSPDLGGEIIAAAACGIVVYEAGGKCALANPTAAELVGATVENLLHQNFRQLESWRSSGMLALAETALSTGEMQKGEFHTTSTYGKEMWLSCKFSVFKRRGQSFLLLIMVDNTRRVAAVLESVEARDFLNQIINAVAHPIFVKDRQHRIVLVNDAACELAGCSREQQLGKPMHDLFPSEQAASYQANDEQVFVSGQASTVEHDLMGRSGQVHRVIVKKTCFKNDAGDEYLVGVVRDITEQKRMEQSLRESEALYQSLVSELPCGIFRKDAAGRFVYVNDQFCRTNGLKAADMLGRLPSEFGDQVTYGVDLPGSDQLRAQRLHLGRKGLANHEHIMRTGESIVLDEILTLWDGSHKYFQVIKTPVRDAAGAIVGSQGMQFDISARKQAELALVQSELRYRSLFKNMAQGLAHCRVSFEHGRVTDWTYLDANTAFLRQTGLEDVVDRKVSELIPKLRTLNPELFECFGRVALTGRPDRFEICLHALGQWYSLAVYSPQPEHIVVIQDVITERKQAEEQLRKLSRAVEQSPVAIVITDNQARIEYVNPKFTQMTGYALADVTGTHPLFMQSGEPLFKHDGIYKNLWDKIATGQEWHGEFQNRKKTGELFWESVSISPIKAANGTITHFVILKEDITRHKQLEGEFRQAQKMEAFGSLAAGVAHDFNNILTAILCNAELMQGDTELNELQSEALAEIKTSGDRAANLTRQLLLFSRQKPMQTKRVQLNEVVENISKMLRRLIGENIHLKTRYCGGETPVVADPGMLEQVLVNLAVNSRDAMPRGGDLIITTEPVTIHQPVARQRSGRFIRFSVSDTGTGITEENLQHIFEPFFTTKDVGKGTGLGLATVFGIVEQHQGWIEVESHVGSGTTFHIFLPRYESAGDTEIIVKPKERTPGGTESILLVEDEPALRKLARSILTRVGYKVYEAGTAAAALEIWRHYQADIALLFTDMVMPGKMSGLELAQQMLQDKPGLKVMYTSGYTDEMLKEGSELRNSPNFLEKPYGTDVLLRKIRKTLDA